ncbi:FIST C-terminal domain-containing protein [Luedemannella flava]
MDRLAAPAHRRLRPRLAAHRPAPARHRRRRAGGARDQRAPRPGGLPGALPVRRRRRRDRQRPRRRLPLGARVRPDPTRRLAAHPGRVRRRRRSAAHVRPLPPYAAVQVVSCGPDDLLDVGDATLAAALDRPDASVALVFSCVARLDILAGRGAEEARRLQAVAGTVPTFGFYTYGEFARTTSVVGYHNATIAAVIL